MSAHKLFCCRDHGTKEVPRQCPKLAIWGTSTVAGAGPYPYSVTYACADDLGHIIVPPEKGHRAEVWPLWNGYDPTTCTLDEMKEAFNNDPLHEGSPPLCAESCVVCHPADAMGA